METKTMGEKPENLFAQLVALINRLCEKEEKQPIVNNYTFNAPVGSYNAHVENMYTGASEGNEQKQSHEKRATKEMMSHAALVTLKEGLWKSQRSWSVVYIVYSIWGFKGRVNEFISEVMDWPDGLASRMVCNRDAVEKLKNMYNFSKDISGWRANGVPEQYCILGERLDQELNNMLQERLN